MEREDLLQSVTKPWLENLLTLHIQHLPPLAEAISKLSKNLRVYGAFERIDFSII